MKAKQIYQKAKLNGISYLTNCTATSENEWQKLMNNSTKANGSIIRKLIKKHLPDLYNDLALNFNNLFECNSRKKENLLIYVSSGVEYFFKIN